LKFTDAENECTQKLTVCCSLPELATPKPKHAAEALNFESQACNGAAHR
jgi:hypothetical protein